MRTDDRVLLASVSALFLGAFVWLLLADGLKRGLFPYMEAIPWFSGFSLGLVFILVFQLTAKQKLFRKLANILLVVGVYFILAPYLTDIIGCYLIWLFDDPFTRIGFSSISLACFYYALVYLKVEIPKLRLEIQRKIVKRQMRRYRHKPNASDDEELDIEH